MSIDFRIRSFTTLLDVELPKMSKKCEFFYSENMYGEQNGAYSLFR